MDEKNNNRDLLTITIYLYIISLQHIKYDILLYYDFNLSIGVLYIYINTVVRFISRYGYTVYYPYWKFDG